MEVSIEQAREIAENELRRVGVQLRVHTVQELPAGWLFFYQSQRYIESGDAMDMYAGNAPLFVARATGKLFALGTANPVEYYLRNYLESGDPHRSLGCKIVLVAFGNGASIVSAIQAVRDATDEGLLVAKERIERLLAGTTVEFSAKSTKHAELLVAQLASCGISAERQ